MVLSTILQWIENSLPIGLMRVNTGIRRIELHRGSDSKHRFRQTRGLIRFRPRVRLGLIKGAVDFTVIDLGEMGQ
jgi:hypothetical protein